MVSALQVHLSILSYNIIGTIWAGQLFGDRPRNSTGCVVVSVATYQQLQRSVRFACGRVGSHCAYCPPCHVVHTNLNLQENICPTESELYICCDPTRVWWGGCTHVYLGLEQSVCDV